MGQPGKGFRALEFRPSTKFSVRRVPDPSETLPEPSKIRVSEAWVLDLSFVFINL